MSLDKRFFRPLGFLSIFAASPTIDAGLQSIPGFFHRADYLRASLGSVITFAALLLMAAGILLCAKLPVGRKLVYWAVAISTPFSIFSAFIQLIGAHALLYGVGYPIAIALLLHRSTPANGVRSVTEDSEARANRGQENTHLRAALA
jgi:hypothetical protein